MIYNISCSRLVKLITVIVGLGNQTCVCGTSVLSLDVCDTSVLSIDVCGTSAPSIDVCGTSV